MKGSRNDGDFMMGILNILLFHAFQPLNGGRMDPVHEDIIAEIPEKVRMALSQFDLEAKTTIYAVCPECHFTYPPIGDTSPKYPLTCNNRRDLGSEECGTRLLQGNAFESDPDSVQKPIKPFVYHSFHDYLASLLSRKDLEIAMNKSCDDLMKDVGNSPPEYVKDVWEAQFLRTFNYPTDRQTLFIDRGEEGRFAFSLNIDFFNIEGMRIHGATTSTGLISMACLNLPPEIRYKPENLYAAIIPGPHQPSLTDLNHYVRPLVDDMVESWERGVRYSRTATRPSGLTTRSAVVAAVMDLPAARHASQLAHHSAHIYCTICQCRDRSTLGRTDYQTWVFRDDAELRKQAELWRAADKTSERDKIFKEHGTRYSEFWRLDYWSP